MESDTGEPQPDTTADGPAHDAPPSGGSGPMRRVEVSFAEGDLTVHGSDDVQVRVSPPGIIHDAAYDPTQESGGVLRFARLPGHAELLVPRGATVTVREVAGDLRAEGLTGALSVGRVGGDVMLADLADAELGRVEGDLRASDGGRLQVREVGGDIHLGGLQAAPVLGRIGGDLEVHGVSGLEARDAISGDVAIEGSTSDVSIRGPVGGDVKVESSAGAVRLGAVGSDLTVRLSGPLAVDGSIGGDCAVSEIAGNVELRGSVGGDLSASLVEGLSIAGAVGGDADMRTVAHAVTLRAVGGDLNAEAIAGALTLHTVGGDVRLRTCLGAADIGVIGGDATIQRATGGVAIARAGGDVVLDTPLAAGVEYQVRAAGDISLRVRGEVNARFVAQTQGGEIRTRLPLAVERGRRRNLVGVLGRGDAGVTLYSDGGDIVITATDSNEEDTMGDEYAGSGEQRTGTGTANGPRSWEGNLGGHKFRVRWEPGASGADATDDPDAMGRPHRGFGIEWEHDPAGDRKAAEDFDRQFNELRERAEQVARNAAEQAQRYAERAARRARETDWEAIGREVRTAIERAMGDLEDTVGQFRRGPSDPNSAGAGSRPSGAQRVRIERDEEPDAYASGYGSGATPETPPAARADVDAQRRAILEQLRAGTISLDDAERRLGELR
jgi:hypothetical protein